MSDNVKPSEVIRLALDKYLGTKDQWCTGREAGGPGGTYYEHDELQLPLNSPLYSTRCGIGALKAAALDFGVQNNSFISFQAFRDAVSKIEEVLSEQHPEFMDVGYVEIPLFNDGIDRYDHSSVGYEGIRSAFEKAAINFEERGE